MSIAEQCIQICVNEGANTMRSITQVIYTLYPKCRWVKRNGFPAIKFSDDSIMVIAE